MSELIIWGVGASTTAIIWLVRLGGRVAALEKEREEMRELMLRVEGKLDAFILGQTHQK